MRRVAVAVAVVALVFPAAACTTKGDCDHLADYERELAEEESINPEVEGRYPNQDRIDALNSLILDALADCENQ
jgi:hypothetical protein